LRTTCKRAGKPKEYTKTMSRPAINRPTASGDALALAIIAASNKNTREVANTIASEAGRAACAKIAKAAAKLADLYQTPPAEISDPTARDAFDLAVLKQQHAANAAARALGNGWACRHAESNANGVPLYVLRPSDEKDEDAGGGVPVKIGAEPEADDPPAESEPNGQPTE